MKEIKSVEKIPWPDTEIVDNFTFDTSAADGIFTFNFKWLNNRWNVWVTLPDKTIREAGVYPNIINWSGNIDYGLVFVSDLTSIDRTSLFLPEIYLIKWV